MTSAIGTPPSRVPSRPGAWDARRGSEMGRVSFKITEKDCAAVVFTFLPGILKPLHASLLNTIVKRSLDSPLWNFSAASGVTASTKSINYVRLPLNLKRHQLHECVFIFLHR